MTNISINLTNKNPKELFLYFHEACARLDTVNKLEQFISQIPINKLEAAIQSENKNFINASDELKQMAKVTKHYLQSETNLVITPTLKTRLIRVLESFLSLLENMVEAFGIRSLFNPPTSEHTSQMNAGRIMMLISLFSTFMALLTPVIGIEKVGLIVGGATLGITILSIILPYIRLAPREIPHGTNWTHALQDGTLDAVAGRKKTLDQIAKVLIASKRVKTHPLLIGDSGIGKTETVKGLTLAIVRGDYPELKGKKIIYFNTAKLAFHREDFGGGNKVLSTISEAMGRHREEYILIFDEIHTAMKTETPISEELKTMLDPGNKNFPYVIAITTKKEYQQDILPNTAFARRLEPIEIHSTTDVETFEILTNTLRQKAPCTIVTPGALNHMIEKLPSMPQPITAQKILHRLIAVTSINQSSDLEKKVEDLRVKIFTEKTKISALPINEISIYSKKDLIPLEIELSKLEEALEKEQTEIKALSTKMERLTKIKTKTMEKINHLAMSCLKNDQEMRSFLFNTHFMIPSLEKDICQTASKLGVKVAITPDLVDTILGSNDAN